MAGFQKLEVETIIAAVAAWAKQQPEIYAIALVGPWARDRTHENSDIDLMFLTSNPALFFKILTGLTSLIGKSSIYKLANITIAFME